MATITYRTGIQPLQWTADWFGPNNTALINEDLRSSTTFVWNNADGTIVTLVGTGFTYDAGEPVLGTVTQVQVRQGNTQIFSITNFSTDLSSLYSTAFGFNQGNGFSQSGNGYNFLSSIYALGNNTIVGSSVADEILAGESNNNDTIDGNGGDDIIKGDQGNDTINGGVGGYDIMTYEDSHYSYRFATRGINANLSTGVVIDCWGFTDNISNFEELRGSKFADVITGTIYDDNFYGYKGADSFNGQGATGSDFDLLWYDLDYYYGGTRGIVANWANGTVKDGFGYTDTMSNIEGIAGTNNADRFTGGGFGVNSYMVGGGGVDVYYGGAGYEGIEFWLNATQGAVVDMNRGLNEIINDGHGNTENYSVVGGAIEFLRGTRFADQFTGNGDANVFVGWDGADRLTGNDGADALQGGRGADILSGGAGADVFEYRYTDEGSDVISSFSSIDFFEFQGSEFGNLAIGVLAASAFQSRASDNFAQQSNDRFIFRQSDDTLWYDATGGNGTAAGAADAILIADITANATVSYTDIVIF